MEPMFYFMRLNKNGFTLIELLIYIGILVLFLTSSSLFFWAAVFGNIKKSAFQEVQQNARFAMTKIGQEIKKAKSINSPLEGSTSSSLSLEMANPDFDPTIFDLSEGKLRITQGENPSVFLTTERVVVKNLIFTNLSYTQTPGIIRVEIEIEYKNPAKRPEYEASVQLKSSFSLLEGGAE